MFGVLILLYYLYMYSLLTSLSIFAWLIMFAVWSYFSFGNKKTTSLPNPIAQIIANTLLFGSPIFLFYPFFKGALATQITPVSTGLGIIGVLLSIAAVAFAIWARLTLGKNWSGAVITLKKDHQLVTSGPYKYVRHPIYTGYFLATLGTALTIGTFASYIATIMIFIGFLIRMNKEETLMTTHFPSEYPAYKQRSKKIIPFIW